LEPSATESTWTRWCSTKIDFFLIPKKCYLTVTVRPNAKIGVDGIAKVVKRFAEELAEQRLLEMEQKNRMRSESET